MERSNTINHLLVAYMSSHGYNFTTALDDPEARREAAKDFRAFLETHPCEVDKDGILKTEKDRENIGEEQTKIQTMIDFFMLADDPENNIDGGRGCISAQLYGNAPSVKRMSFNELIKSERRSEPARRLVRSSSMVEKHSEEKERRTMRELGKNE